ncbi:MAG: hypothetical protein RIQ59_1844 [Bacteroidota bacterium]|jgi:hypothetical protein
MKVSVRESIKEQLYEIKKEKSKIYYCIELTFDAIKFNEHFHDYKNFWHLLTTSYFGPKGLKKSNNDWYNELQPEGFYFINESYNLVQYRIYLETKKKMDIDEFEARVTDIAPLLELESYENDEYKFSKMFANDIFKVQKSEIQYIGRVDFPEIEDEELPF